MKKKIVSLLVVAACAVTLAACGGNGGGNNGGGTTDASTTDSATASDDATAEAPSDGTKILSVQVGPDPETLDPALNSAVDGANVILHAFECLLAVDEKGAIVPGQAESFEVSDDGLTYTFHLRDGLKWSDGTDLVADDFVYTYKRVCDPMIAAPYADTVLSMVVGFDEAIEGNLDALGVSAPDAKTFVVELANPCPYFDSLAAFATLSPVQPATVEANGDAWAIDPSTYVSNGPFRMAEWVPGSYILFEKNPNYWNADAVKLDGLRFALIEDSNAAYSAYQTGDVSMIKDVPTEEIPSLNGQSDFYIDPIIGTYYISVNTDLEQFKDSNVRKALSLAIDRQYVADVLMQQTYSPAPNFMGPGWSDPAGGEFMVDPYIDIDNYDANLEEAKALLAEAGYPDGAGFPSITYSTNDAGYHRVLAEYLQQAWGELGLDVKVDIVEWASFTPMRRNGDYEIARNGWVGDYADPSNMIELLYSTNGNNDGNYNNPEFDAAIDESRVTMDTKARSEALHKAEDILMEDSACIPVAYYNDFFLIDDNIKGWWHSAYGYWYFMYADF